MRRVLFGLLASLSFTPEVRSAEYLTTVTSEVYSANGSAEALSRSATTCMARHLASGQAGGQVIVSSDNSTGLVVANNALEYRDGLLMWPLRSRVTFEAREGRFRIEHSSIERFIEGGRGWFPVGKWRGSGAAKAEAALVDVSSLIASCVMNGRSAVEDW